MNYSPNINAARVAIAILNEALTTDREAISRLLLQRVPCNAALTDHPTIQCAMTPEKEVSALGLINGLFGILSDGSVPGRDGWGLITAIVSDDLKTIERFTCTVDEPGAK